MDMPLASSRSQRRVTPLRTTNCTPPSPDYAEVPEDWLWLATVTLLTDACIRLGDRHDAVALYRPLCPYRDETVIVAHGVASLGPVMPRLDALVRLTPEAEASDCLARDSDVA